MQLHWLIVAFAGLISLAECVQNSSTDTNNSSDDGQGLQTEERGIGSRTGKAISFFPGDLPSSSGNYQLLPETGLSDRQKTAAVARRIRFGYDEDSSYVNSVSNDIGGSSGSVEIGERHPVYAYKRPDDGSIYQSSNPSSNGGNYYARPYSYSDQGQYYNPQPDPNYYSQTQQQSPPQSNYYRPVPPSRPHNTPRPPSSSRPVSQTYQHIPYPQSQGYLQQPATPQYSQHQPDPYTSYPQQYPQQSPYSGLPQRGPYYMQQQQQQQRPPQRPLQYDNYSPNYPYQGESGGGVGGLLGGLGNLFSGNGIGSGGGGGGGPQNGLGAVGGQFGYAIENIVRFDDYQCVPKIVCQMVGNPQRQATLPGWLNAPSLTALISAVPSTSPMLVFGRAALLGLSGGENNCDSSFPRCPRNEDDVLNYLNNHRGGFFRFFNGGATYGDESDYGYDEQQYQPQQQQQSYQQYQQQSPVQQQQQPQQQSPLQGLDLGTIQSFAEAINQGGGINLSNLGSNLGLLGNLASLGSALGSLGGGAAATPAAKPTPQKQQPASSSSSLGSNLSLLSNLGSQLGLGNTVSNLLTGIVGARYNGRKARKLSKRSAELSDESLDELLLSLGEEPSTTDSDGPPSKKRNLNKEIGDDATKVEHIEKAGLQKKKKYHQELEKKEKIRAVEKFLGIQARIINKEEIQAESEQRIVHGNSAIHSESLLLNPIVFPEDYEPVVHINSPRPITAAPVLTFPSQDTREQKQLQPTFAFPSGFQASDVIRGGKAFQFSHSAPLQPSPQQVPFNKLQFPETFQNSDGIILDIPQPLPLEYYDRTKMIFPDRTGTGNLRFDSEEFNQQEPFNFNQNRIRIGRILTGASQNPPVSYQGNYNENHSGSTSSFNRGDVLIFHSNSNGNNNYNNPQARPQFDFGNRYPLNNNQVNNNRYQVQQRPTYQSQNYGSNQRYQNTYNGGNNNRDDGQKIYVTNGQGVVTYYVNERGEKIAV